MKMYTTTQHALCAAIRSYLNMSAGAEEAKLFKFSDGEALIQLAAAPAPAETTVVIQAVSAPVNDSLVHTVFLLEALRLACASSVVLVITYLGYSRQDRPTRQLSLTAAGVVCKMLSAANVSRAYVVEAHSAAATALLAPPSFNLPITALVCEHISRRWELDHVVIVALDQGGAARASQVARALGAALVVGVKRRSEDGVAVEFGDALAVKHKTAVIVDDIVDTGGSAAAAAEALTSKHKANAVMMCCAHGVLSAGKLASVQVACSDSVGGVSGALTLSYLLSRLLKRIAANRNHAKLLKADS